MSKPNIAIFDYGAGNLFSLKTSLEKNGADKIVILNDLKGIEKFDGLILPGVGNFDPAIKTIEKSKEILVDVVNKGFPVLGICLGMEMLFENSEEGKLNGLSIFNGNVKILPSHKVKIPHMGWNNLDIVKSGSKILEGIKDRSWVYFVHSYRIVPKKKDTDIVVANTNYGIDIPVVIEKNNLFGTQFHPEKSGTIGAKIMKNFIEACNKK
ncbi:MAG: imidazole glycerol phosphate synthase subunit HisH [Nitrososphaeraceae archaeon]|nr:imidazole glycerol phosphate synthase subunit HisH [Nitrososphaeraceae archaeon]